ncbi:OmpA family protein [Novosphingobium sp.]|uniref:OmpA family protein n=1 Tax=Novosphingobium sp. TaxID=1874826 RepID=UPI0035AE7CAC
MRKLIAMVILAALAACATVPHGGFSSRQAKALEATGFKRVGDNYELGMADRVLFDFDQSDLNTGTAGIIDNVANVLLKVGIHGAGVEGHTDAMGSSDYNQRLSERRAVSVKMELVRAGMKDSAIRAAGYGESRPIADNATEEGRAQNRRVVIVVTPADAVPLRN